MSDDPLLRELGRRLREEREPEDASVRPLDRDERRALTDRAFAAYAAEREGADGPPSAAVPRRRSALRRIAFVTALAAAIACYAFLRSRGPVATPVAVVPTASVSVEPPTQTRNEPGSVTVIVNTDPPSRTVTVDGRPWEGDPTKLVGLTAGEPHTIVVFVTGYMPKAITILANPGETTTITEVLTKRREAPLPPEPPPPGAGSPADFSNPYR